MPLSQYVLALVYLILRVLLILYPDIQIGIRRNSLLLKKRDEALYLLFQQLYFVTIDFYVYVPSPFAASAANNFASVSQKLFEVVFQSTSGFMVWQQRVDENLCNSSLTTLTTSSFP